MPWTTPTLEQLRALNRDNVTSQLHSGPMIPNSVLRVMADSNAGLAYLVLLYINWLSRQLLPDTAETDWLDRHGNIWKPGGSGRKAATFASGTLTVTGLNGTVVPNATQFNGQASDGTSVLLQSTASITIGAGATPLNFVSLVAGQTNLQVGNSAVFVVGIAGADGAGAITAITDGIAQETDDELRERVLERIQQPPVGGDAEDFVQWAKATPGVNVTRAWCSPLEMGIGTLTVRFMTDDQVNSIPGFPSPADILTVQNYIDTKRPVAIKDRFILSPIPEPIDFIITNLSPDTVSVRSAIAVAVRKTLMDRAAPAHATNGVEQEATTVYAAWVSEAIASVDGVDTFTLTMADHPMPYQSSLAVLGTIIYG